MRVRGEGLSYLQSLAALTDLDLNTTRIDNGAGALAGVVSLERLVLTDTGVLNQGMAAFIKPTRLRDLDCAAQTSVTLGCGSVRAPGEGTRTLLVQCRLASRYRKTHPGLENRFVFTESAIRVGRRLPLQAQTHPERPRACLITRR